MSDLVSTISSAITLASRLKEISNNIQDAEFKNLLADLRLELADAKNDIATLLEENTELKSKLRSIENADGEPCPRCHKRGWHIESSKPDSVFGNLGGVRRLYKCSVCDFSEEQLVTEI